MCPKEWAALEATEIETQKFCSQCNELVYLCVSDEETLSHARAGHCIARELPDVAELPAMIIGRPKDLPVVTETQQEAAKWAQREHGIDDSLKNVTAERSCPECHYPAPRWREVCRVCGFKMGRAKQE